MFGVKIKKCMGFYTREGGGSFLGFTLYYDFTISFRDYILW